MLSNPYSEVIVPLHELKQDSPVYSEPTISDPTESNGTSQKEQQSASSEKKREKVVLPIGKTLRLLALDLYGNKEFWVYIYMENKDIIQNPHRVPSGIELRLPDKTAYSIDAADLQSISRATSLSREVLGAFK